MSGFGGKNEKVKTDKRGMGQPKKSPPPKANEDEDYEDGAYIATPKRDRDDEQQGL